MLVTSAAAHPPRRAQAWLICNVQQKMTSWFSNLFRSADQPPDHIVPPPEEEIPLVREYLIRRTDGDWFDLPKDKFEAILSPESFESSPVDGWGDHRIRVRDFEVSFSYEDPGIQVSFYGANIAIGDSDKIVEEIAQKITKCSGQGSKVVPL